MLIKFNIIYTYEYYRKRSHKILTTYPYRHVVYIHAGIRIAVAVIEDLRLVKSAIPINKITNGANNAHHANTTHCNPCYASCREVARRRLLPVRLGLPQVRNVRVVFNSDVRYVYCIYARIYHFIVRCV